MGIKFNGTSTQIAAKEPNVTGNIWTMAAWVNPGTQNNTNNYVLSLGKAASDGTQIVVAGAGLGLSSNYGGVGSTGWGKSLTAGVWAHVLQTQNGGAGTFYVNGVQTGTTGLTPLAPTGKFVIGNWDTGTEFFTGLIADVAVWDANLKVPQIAALGLGILRPNQVRPQDLISWWPLGVQSIGAGGAVPDLSSFGNTGVGTGSPIPAPDPPFISERVITLLPGLVVPSIFQGPPPPILHAQIVL